MDKNLRNEFYKNNMHSIDNMIDYCLKTSGYKNIIAGFLKYNYKSYNDDLYVANMHINSEDIKQQLILEIFNTLEKKKYVNLSYIKMLCEDRLKNIFKKYFDELEKSIMVDDYKKKKNSLPCISEEYLTIDVYANMVIEKAMLEINDPLEKKYLEIFAGNIGIMGYEEFAIHKSTKDVSDDCTIASKLGFDSPKKSKYCKVKKTVTKCLADVVKSMNDVA